MTVRKAVRAIMIRDNKELLVMKREKPGQLYYSLVGGGIDEGESKEQALRREVKEETGLDLANPREVFTSEELNSYGPQFVFVCDYVGGEPKLDPSSEEALGDAPGVNVHTPMWLPLEELQNVNLLSESLKMAILKALDGGFPKNVIKI